MNIGQSKKVRIIELKKMDGEKSTMEGNSNTETPKVIVKFQITFPIIAPSPTSTVFFFKLLKRRVYSAFGTLCAL